MKANGEKVAALDDLPVFEWHEQRYWEMALAVWREMNSGMGRGLLESLLDYCRVTGIDDPEMVEDYYQVMSAALPARKKDAA